MLRLSTGQEPRPPGCRRRSRGGADVCAAGVVSLLPGAGLGRGAQSTRQKRWCCWATGGKQLRAAAAVQEPLSGSRRLEAQPEFRQTRIMPLRAQAGPSRPVPAGQ